jgi:hypothetical protein
VKRRRPLSDWLTGQGYVRYHRDPGGELMLLTEHLKAKGYLK